MNKRLGARQKKKSAVNTFILHCKTRSSCLPTTPETGKWRTLDKRILYVRYIIFSD